MRPSQIASELTTVVVLCLVIFNAWHILARDYCIHMVEISIYCLVSIALLTLAHLVLKRFNL